MHLLLSLPLNSSGTEEEYSELSQLLQDISDYQRDLQAAKLKERESRKLKELNEKAAGEEMRKSAMETMARKYYHVIILVFLFDAERKRRRETNRDNFDETDDFMLNGEEMEESGKTINLS